MSKFTSLTGVAAPIDTPDVNTDLIIPSRFLLYPRSVNHAEYLFHDLRNEGPGAKDFVLNRPEFRRAIFIVGNSNFGCGSSREQAAYAFVDYGVRAIIASSFGDIFRNSCVKNGLLPARVSPEASATLRQLLHDAPGSEITVDLENMVVTHHSGLSFPMEISPQHRELLLSGEDHISATLRHGSAIKAFETNYLAANPWIVPPANAGAASARNPTGVR